MLRSTAIAGAEVRRRRVSADSVGAGLVGAAAGEVGGERRELRGHQQTAAKFSSTLTATLASLAQRYGSESSAEFARVHQLCLSHACARGAIERCQPTDPPVRLTRSSRRRGCWPTSTRRIAITGNKATANQSPLLKLYLRRVPFQKNVYASAIGLCKDSIIMQSTKPSNSDFCRSFNM
jgi:hypothetical protein